MISARYSFSRPNVMPAPPYGEMDGNARLVAWWPMSMPSGAAVSDVVSRSSAVLTAATWATSEIGHALDFSGTNAYVNLGQVPQASGSVSMSIWMKPDTYTNPGTDFGVNWVIGRTQWGDSTGNIILFIVGGQALARVQTSGGEFTATYTTPATPAPVGKWSHWCVVFSEITNTIKLYINGVQFASTNTSGTLAAGTLSFSLGAANGNTNTEMDGQLADARIYKGALTPAQVRALAMPETRWASYWVRRQLWIPVTVVTPVTGTSALTAAAATITASGVVVTPVTGTSALTAAAATLAATGTASGVNRSRILLLGVG